MVIAFGPLLSMFERTYVGPYTAIDTHASAESNELFRADRDMPRQATTKTCGSLVLDLDKTEAACRRCIH